MARIAIEMPKLGYDMETGTIAAWVKNVGDTVSRGDVLAEIETEKSTVEMEALAGGTLVEQTLDARRGGPGGHRHRLPRGRQLGPATRRPIRDADRGPATHDPGTHPRHVRPDAPGDRPADGPEQADRAPLLRLARPRDGRRDGRPGARSTTGAAREERATVTALLLKAIASTLTAFPAFNAVWNGETLERVDAINLGVAIDLGDAGLIAPGAARLRQPSRSTSWARSCATWWRGPRSASCARRRSRRARSRSATWAAWA